MFVNGLSYYVLNDTEVIPLQGSPNGGFLISKIKQIQARVFERLLAGRGGGRFSGAQGRILYVLWRNDGIPISRLAEATGLTKTTLTGQLDRLESGGYIRRAPDPTDRRKAVIRLTDAAQTLRPDYDEVSRQMNRLFYRGFTDAEIADFEGKLTRILNNLTGKEE